MNTNSQVAVATFAAGCFWCIEAAFQQLNGVQAAISGYMGGQTEDPDYRSVCSGLTGHAEVVQVSFDPAQISFDQLLDVFFFLHDPTQLNRQGNDIGSQYRSAIFYQDALQLQQATLRISQLKIQHSTDKPVVTTLEAASKFYPAEAYHQGYALNHPHQPYCQLLVLPKLAKFRQQFSGLLKTQ